MSCRVCVPFVFLLLILMSLNTANAKQKPINIALSGKWKSTSLLLETSEFFAKDSNNLFWRFVDHVADQGHDYFELASDEVKYMFIQKYAGDVLSPLELSFLKFSLSLRAYSPAIQMFQQLAEQIPATNSCSTFIEVNGAYSCDTNALSELLTTSVSRSPAPIYKFDHIYPGKSSGKKTTVVILYTELGTNEFKEFHPALAQLAKVGEITYCIRHFVKNMNPKNVRLAGYGVELAIKSTEYKAKDDTKVEGDSQGESGDDDDDGEEVDGIVFSKLRELHPQLKNELKEFKNHLLDSATELMPFKVWQLQDLGFQAAQKIMSVSQFDALQYLRDISQNFPTQARSLVRQTVTTELKKEIRRNQQVMDVAPGSSAFFLNGLSVDLETYDIFTLLEVMTSEASLVEGLHSLGYQGDSLQKLLQLDLGEGKDQSYAVDIRHTGVQYLNDLSKDKAYRTWPNSIQDLLRPSFPGMLRHVAKNLFHLVFVVDPANPESKSLLKMAEAFVVHKAPLRLGLVFSCDSDPKTTDGFSSPCVAFTRAFNFILMDQGSAASGLSFITDVFEKIEQNELTSDAIINEFTSQYPGEDKDLVFGVNDDYDDIRKAGVDFVSRIGLIGLPQVVINGVPLNREQIKMDNFEESVVMEVLKQTQIIQTAVYQGQVTDKMDILDWWMERDNVLPRLNSRILAPTSNRLDLTGTLRDDMKKLTPAQAASIDDKTLTAFVCHKTKYITRKDEDTVRPVTLWVATDLETVEGRDLLYSAIRHLKTSNHMRLGLIFNPSQTSLDKNLINRAVHVALETLSLPLAKSLVTKLVKEENVEELRKGTKTLRDLEVHGMDMDAYMKAFDAQTGNFLKIDQTYASGVLSLQHGERAVVTNGAILGPLGKEEEMSMEDFNLLEKVALNRGAGSIMEAIKRLKGSTDNEKTSNAVMKVFNLLLSKSKQEKRHKVEYEGDIHSVIKLEADSKIPAFTVEAIVNPVSSEAQKLSSILMVMKEIANVDIRIYLNPVDKLSEMPLKSFYRYVLEPEVTFNSEGMLSDGPSARFLDMPQKSLLTLKMDTPESWLVEAVTSPYDLDNILLEEVERSVNADFELEYLLLEGHCHDATTMQPPRGLQFVLGTNSTTDLVDTIVMANLGYFQLKANPGLWQLRLREGRSNEIYNIESHELTDTPDGLSDVVIAISSFKSKTIRVKVSKKPDKADQSLLQDEGESGGLWDSFANTFTGSTKSEEDKEDSTLNIFSVASGHLYERFLRIMMLSVLKNTQSKVKFWFLKNFLSPSFKDFIPYMAKEYGFEYELVQYKWPHWLNQQKEKQRIIWGYKILFLDVLFPLDVKKIIFVDADQIVRADLQELHDLDLGGAPYGYTPFCDSKREMDGFRFWNSGYWKSHLAGRKYHISALYVVDLKRFRRIAAGDRLRGQYQGLSQDPNSLANLDQDLPNNMIHQVSIKSLPQEWLYCETWCSESTKPQAKTIDLCNNPLTKEPKLKAAMRIVPEWKNYDYEIKVLWDDIYNTNTKSQIEYDPPDVSSDNRRKVKEEL